MPPVSKSLLFEFDPINQPAAPDPVERATWCALRIRVGDRCVSTFWDKDLRGNRENLYVPAFPIAAWIVENWWVLLNERPPGETIPAVVDETAQFEWTRRHCLRAADSSLMLPALYVYHDGRDLTAEWRSDAPGAMPHMPGEFSSDGRNVLEATATRVSLAQFVATVVDRVRGLSDRRVEELDQHWRAIQSADAEEERFCILAGRMGIDPYDAETLDVQLTRFLETAFPDPDLPIVRDLTEVTTRGSIREQWAWLESIRDELNILPNERAPAFTSPTQQQTPSRFGYQAAREARRIAGLAMDSPLDSVEGIARPVLGRKFRIVARNHVPGRGVQSMVGVRDGEVVAVGPQPQRQGNQRFRAARGFYHALTGNSQSPRLVTSAYSWDQKASRAFAAELLAPQSALRDRALASPVDRETVEALSNEFAVSERVIENQLENAGISLSCE